MCVSVCVCVVANVFVSDSPLPPDSFPAEQLYVVMAVENAGSAVESYQVTVNGGFLNIMYIIVFGGLSSSLLSSHQWRRQSVSWVKWQGLWP